MVESGETSAWPSDLGLTYVKLCRWIDDKLGSLLSGPHWRIKALLWIIALTAVRAFPSYDALSTEFVQAKWHFAQIKFDNPLIDNGKVFSSDLHQSNLTFRLTVPLVAHVLKLGMPGVLILSALAGVVMLYRLMATVYRLAGTKQTAFFICLGVACTWPGATAYHELRGGYYDAVALCLLVLALSTSSTMLISIYTFLAAWTDERALIASSVSVLFWGFNRSTANRSKAVAVIVAGTVYVGIRAYLTARYSYNCRPIGVGLSVFLNQINIMPLAIWTGLGGNWIIVLCGMVVLFLRKRYLMAMAFLGSVGAVMAVAVVVIDVTRSMAYCLPAVLVGLNALIESESPKTIKRFATISGVVSFIIPTYYVEGSTGLWWLYPLPFQLGRWVLAAVVR